MAKMKRSILSHQTSSQSHQSLRSSPLQTKASTTHHRPADGQSDKRRTSKDYLLTRFTRSVPVVRRAIPILEHLGRLTLQ